MHAENKVLVSQCIRVMHTGDRDGDYRYEMRLIFTVPANADSGGSRSILGRSMKCLARFCALQFSQVSEAVHFRLTWTTTEILFLAPGQTAVVVRQLRINRAQHCILLS
jgi:hypothetical protein